MSMVKDRKTFSLHNFRGLDKENKAVKVSAQRASDGLNFMLDSDTLKTRPAFQFLQRTPFYPETGEYVIGWHAFNGVMIYVTNKHIRIQNGTLNFTEADNPIVSGASVLIKSTFQTLDFSGKQPLFREEKDCVFIFAVGAIYVFSLLLNTDATVYRYVLYELSQKPANPFSISNDFYQDFEDLPTPYVPTIYLGDRTFEDVNLLSPSTKYKLFAGSGVAADGKKIYFLPTHYKQSKHIGFTPVIEFYKNRFHGLDKFPVFMGVLGENFTTISDFGTVPSGFTAISVDGTFYPKRDFEYYGASTDPSPTKIIEEYGIDRNTFFNMRLSTGQTIFEYLISYITTETIASNTVLYFDIAAKCRTIFRNATTNYIDEILYTDKTFSVYVQIKKYDELSFALLSQELKSSAQVYEEDTGEAYPDYPSIAVTPDYTVDLGTTLKDNYNANDFKNMAIANLFENKSTYADGDIVYVKGRLYYVERKTVAKAANLALVSHWDIGAEDTNITWNVPSSITDGDGPNDYPSFANPNGHPVIEYGSLITHNGWTFDFSIHGALYNQVKEAILSRVGVDTGLILNSGTAFAKIKVQTQFDDGFGNTYQKGVSIVVPFTYQKAGTYDFQVRQSFSFTCEVSKSSRAIVDNLYRFELSDDESFFKFTLNDYFFDYNNEPSIEIAVTFDANPDYDIIANSTFGVTFGGENRLFLAGNPDYPNIDRFNVSNDLLGDNVKGQSYELSYFPSKNYRVLGGRGAINGYVIATDNQLYVTKAEYPNDNLLYVRIRNINENGSVWYQEFKTSVNKSPLNHRCLARFYNDVVILSRDGLYAIELSSNVLTDERLLKRRSGFINKDMMADAATIDRNDAFIVEDNNYMYMFIGSSVYVADSRYIASNPNGEIDNYSYEIVKWESPNLYSQGRIENNILTLLLKNGSIFYQLQDADYDEVSTAHESAISLFDHNGAWTENNAFMLSAAFDGMFDEPLKWHIRLEHGYRIMARSGSEYHLSGNRLVFDNVNAFIGVQDGDTLYFKDTVTGVYWPFVVSGYTAFGFDIPSGAAGNRSVLYLDISDRPLYIVTKFELWNDGGIAFRLSPYKPDAVETYAPLGGDTESMYYDRVLAALSDFNDYAFESGSMFNIIKTEEKIISLLWVSAITDFGNALYEKTMFRTNFYATKKAAENNLYFGYKTMRRLQTLNDQTQIAVTKQIDLASTFDFGGVDLSTFSLNTFNEFGLSIPAKENNFLYIQFIVLASGRMELNAIEIIYKLNRLMKTIG